jgi:cytochrome c oxidase cbb3-type subunit 4
MDIGLIQGIWTIVALVLFVGIVVWAWSSARREPFARAAAQALEDDSRPPPQHASNERAP